MTYILLQKLSPLVSPVARGMAAIELAVLAIGSNLNEVVVSITVPPE